MVHFVEQVATRAGNLVATRVVGIRQRQLGRLQRIVTGGRLSWLGLSRRRVLIFRRPIEPPPMCRLMSWRLVRRMRDLVRIFRYSACVIVTLAALGTVGLVWADTAGSLTEGARILPVGTGISVDEMPPVMREAYIRGIQEELTGHGYDPGPIDGTLGPRTKRAIHEYQRDAGLPVDGRATKELLDHLKFALPKVYKGEQGPAYDQDLVIAIQEELSDRGYYLGAMDGIPGPQTRAAVRLFQEEAGLPVTGVVDERLLGELRAADPEIRAQEPI